MWHGPTRPARQHTVALQLSSRFLRRIPNEVLRIHLYKIHITHELTEQDKTSCTNFCMQFLELVDNDEVSFGCFDHVRWGQLLFSQLHKQTEFQGLEW
jgi:hypothetical protein